MDILTMLAWIAFAVAAMYLINFIALALSLMVLAIAMSINSPDNQYVNKVNLGMRHLWYSLAATVVGIILISL